MTSVFSGLEKEQLYFKRNREKLLSEYPNGSIAIYGEKVIQHRKHEITLISELNKAEKHKGKTFLLVDIKRGRMSVYTPL